MSNIAVVGDSTTALAFRSLGIDAYSFDEPEAVIDYWPRIVERGYAVIIMTEPIIAAAEALVSPLAIEVLPAVVPIPSVAGSTGWGREQIDKLVEMVIGSIGSREEQLD